MTAADSRPHSQPEDVSDVSDEVVDQALADLEASTERPVVRQWHSEVSLDAARHWAWGIGDDNPLWTEPRHGAESRWGELLAPPSFLYSCSQGPNHFRSEPSRGRGQPGLHAVWAGDRWSWHRPLTRGTQVRATKRLHEVDVRERPGRPRSLVLTTRYAFRDGNDDLLATLDTALLHRARGARSSTPVRADRPVRTAHVWDDASRPV